MSRCKMEVALKLLESYRGRDKILRICTFACLWIGGSRRTLLAQRVRIFAKELSAARTVLRLFDDLPMLVHTVGYGTGPKDQSLTQRALGVLSNAINQCFYPLEHISWLADKQLISGIKPGPFMAASIAAWALSLTVSMMRTVLTICQLRKSRRSLKKQEYLDHSKEAHEITDQNKNIKEKLIKMKQQEIASILTIIGNMLDFMNAIHWLPPGFLWSGKLSPETCGMLGTLSSAILLYGAVSAMPTKKS